MGISEMDGTILPQNEGSSVLLPFQTEKVKNYEQSRTKRNSIASTDISSPVISPSSIHSPRVTYRGTAPLKSFRELHRRMVLSENASSGSGEQKCGATTSPATTLNASENAAPKVEHLVHDQGKVKQGPPSVLQTLVGQQKTDFVRPSRLIRRDESLDFLRPTLMSADIIEAKERGGPLPYIRQKDIDMINEPLTPETVELIQTIPSRHLLQKAGIPGYTADPMFVEEVKDYRPDYPFAPRMLQQYPNYGEFPLLLSKFQRDELSKNIVDFSKVSSLRGHNEYMMENVNYQPPHPYPQLRETFMYVPNLGRVQGMLAEFKDGSTFPLVTLPKMTPRDILKVMDRQQQLEQRRCTHQWQRFLNRVFCGLMSSNE